MSAKYIILALKFRFISSRTLDNFKTETVFGFLLMGFYNSRFSHSSFSNVFKGEILNVGFVLSSF